MSIFTNQGDRENFCRIFLIFLNPLFSVQHLSVKEKYEIILYNDVHSKATHAQLRNIFDIRFKKYIGNFTIGKFTKQKSIKKA